MSYAQRHGDTRRPSPPPSAASVGSGNGPASGSAAAEPLLSDSVHADEQRAVAAVQKIQQHVAEIQKLTQQLSAPNASAMVETSRKKVQDAEKSATDIASNVKAILERIPTDAKGVSKEELMLRTSKKQKLTENLSQCSEQLRVAIKTYEQRDQQVCKEILMEAAQAAAAASSSPRATASRPAWKKPQARQAVVSWERDPNAVELIEGGSVAVGSGPQLEAMRDVSEAEIVFHGHIAGEFAQEVTTLRDDLSDLNQCMATMAALTAEQGETLDNIESHIGEAADQSGGAREQLVQAAGTQRAGNKWLWLILLFMIVFMLILIIALLVRH